MFRKTMPNFTFWNFLNSVTNTRLITPTFGKNRKQWGEWINFCILLNKNLYYGNKNATNLYINLIDSFYIKLNLVQQHQHYANSMHYLEHLEALIVKRYLKSCNKYLDCRFFFRIQICRKWEVIGSSDGRLFISLIRCLLRMFVSNNRPENRVRT